MGSLWRSCAKLREPIELSFVVVSWVGSSIGVLDEFHVPQAKGEVSGVFWSIGLNGVLGFTRRECIRLVRMGAATIVIGGDNVPPNTHECGVQGGTCLRQYRLLTSSLSRQHNWRTYTS